MKLLRLGNGQVTFSVIAIFGEGALHPAALEQNGLRRRASYGDTRRNQQAVVHLVSARADLERISRPQQVRGFLQRRAVCAYDVRLSGSGNSDCVGRKTRAFRRME